MYFATLPTSETIVYGMLKTAARFGGGVTRVATMTCVEGAACSDFKRLSAQIAPKAGVQIVYQADVSLAQPDFTSECLQASNRGAQILWPVGDQNLVHRVARSCARQGFRPQYVQATISEKETEFPLLDGQVHAGGSFPFIGVKGTFTDEYTQAMRRYFPKQELATLTPSAWSMGKIFERAVTLALQRTSRLTSNDILEALWTFRGETLGGLNVPLTYTKNRPASVARCWYTVRMKDGRWLTPDGVKPSCWT
jgi:branched-chain amino acid transport system substrate-binding protein